MRRFEGFEHEDMHVTNPTMSECGWFTLSPQEYGFRVAAIGGGRTAWVRELPSQRHIRLTDSTGMTAELGSDCDPFLLSVYTDGESEP